MLQLTVGMDIQQISISTSQYGMNISISCFQFNSSENLRLYSQTVISKPKFDVLSNGTEIFSNWLQENCSIVRPKSWSFPSETKIFQFETAQSDITKPPSERVSNSIL
jgi:hypothetical protein